MQNTRSARRLKDMNGFKIEIHYENQKMYIKMIHTKIYRMYTVAIPFRFKGAN